MYYYCTHFEYEEYSKFRGSHKPIIMIIERFMYLARAEATYVLAQ